MMLTLLLALLPQDPAPPAPPAPNQPQLELMNGVYLVVNEEVVTYADFYRGLRRRNQPVGTEAERQRAMAENHADLVRQMLMTQAGRDLGFDPQRVKSIVDEDIKGFVEEAGSVLAFGAELQGSNMDPQELREQREDFYYRQLFQGSIDGRTQGAAGRPYVDRFVRPGRIYYEYRRQPADEIFPATVVLQELALDARRAGSAQEALDLATALRERALAGEDFSDLVTSYSSAATDRKGLLPRLTIERATEVLPDLREFFANAQPGQISEPQPIRSEGELIGFRLLKVVDVDHLRAASFGEREVQDLLRERFIGRMGDWRRDRALVDLFRAAYIWPPEARPQG